MTRELHEAMARHEEARGRYRLAVLASLRGAGRGDAILRAIRECQAAGEDVRRLAAPAAPDHHAREAAHPSAPTRPPAERWTDRFHRAPRLAPGPT